MGGGIPQGAVGVSVAVLIYSFFCLTCSSLTVGLLLSYGESWTYVTLLCSFTTLSTVASIVQQFHYAFAWEVIKQAEFDSAVQSLSTPALGLGGAFQIVDAVLFDIQFYCYNVLALIVLFWSVALFCGSWGIRSSWLGDWHERVSPISKVFAVLFPGIIVGLSRVPASFSSAGAFFAVTSFTMLGCLSVGSILLILILYKYMKTRRLLAGAGKRGGWWASASSKNTSRNRDIGAEGTMESGVSSDAQRRVYDRALLTRFTIGFVILAVFEAAIIGFSLYQQPNNNAIAKSGAPNHKVSNTISDILFFIPGVTASLVVFLVFGTTKSWRQYRDLVVGGCGVKRKIYERRSQGSQREDSAGLEFERLPSLPHRTSEDHAAKAERRVRMFVTSVSEEPEARDAVSPPPVAAPESSAHGRAASTTSSRAFEFHKPRYVDMAQHVPPSPTRSSVSTSGVIPLSLASKPLPPDPVIQYDRSDEEQYIGMRRFVNERLPQNDSKNFLADSSE